MLRVTSLLQGCSIQAKDGRMGVVGDILFDAHSWQVRWLVVDIGSWLSGRKVLIHPSAIGESDGSIERLYVELTMDQIAHSPGIRRDPPVSEQISDTDSDYNSWDPIWGDQEFNEGSRAYPLIVPPLFAGGGSAGQYSSYARSEDQDPNLWSASAAAGYHICAIDGSIGHLQDFLVDDEAWAIRYLIIDTKNWLHGARVMVAPKAVVKIDLLDHNIRLNITCEEVSNSHPAWESNAKLAPEQARAAQLRK